MNGNLEILNYIYQNSQMGVSSVKQVIEASEDQDFLQLLNSNLQEYSLINDEAKNMIIKKGREAKDINMLSKMSASMGIKMKTMTDNSKEHLAEMMIQGSTMGIIDAQKNINKYPNADEEILNLAKRLLDFEQKNFEDLKAYL